MTRSDFTVPVTLPSGTKIRVHELTNRDYLTLNKFCENEDFDGFIKFIDLHLIPEFVDIDIIDKAYALVLYRSLFLGEELQVLNSDQQTIKFTTEPILDAIKEIERKELTVAEGEFTIDIGPIKQYTNTDGNLYGCITRVTAYGEDVCDLQIDEIMNNLPPRVFSKVSDAIMCLYEYYNNTEIISANENIKLPSLCVNLADATFQQFIMSIFKTDLSVMFDTMFVFAQHFKNIDYFQLAPLDSRILETTLHREITEAKKAQEQSQAPQHINPLTPQ